MKVIVTCCHCGNKYRCNGRNTTISGPGLETVCPSCNTSYVRNVSAYASDQADIRRLTGRLPRARFMITLMQDIGAAANEDKHGVKMRKYMK